MSNNLTDLLIQLGEDPAKLQEFQKNPDFVMEAAGLSEAQRTAVISRDGQAIVQSLIAEGQILAPVWVRPLEVLQINAPA
jgi:hypothetical protein